MATFEKLKTFIFSDAFRSVAMVIVVLLLVGQYWDRHVGINKVNANIDRFEISRKMLGARAKIQVILLNQALENRPLTAMEIDTIKQLWQTADLDTSEDNPKEN